ncbi:MAG: cation:proton antiporter [Vicinamibacteria bacterium]|nr:cation:proton antiporter [Vicinamibacteria bacterium]
MNALTSLGLILLLALLAGHLVKFVRVPEVTGYILAGVVLGPSVLGWVSRENLTALEILSEVALGLMLFSIGTVFELDRLRRTGRQFLVVTLVESALAGTIVTVGMLGFGQPWQVAFLLGAVAIATAPASTLMVIRETDSSGPLTEILLGIIAINNIFCIVAYSLVASAIDLTASLGSGNLFHSIYTSFFPLVWQLVGSVALGYIVGVVLSLWSSQVKETGEMLILMAGSILFCVGAARMMDLSTLIASMAVGATMVNLSTGSHRLFETLSGTDPPFYAIFFVLAGADLDLTLVRALGWLGVVYVLGRALGKFVGARVAARHLRLPPAVQNYLGFALLAQAGLAVGLTISIERRFVDYAPVVSAIVLAAVAIYEMFGPISARYALIQSGEARLGASMPEDAGTDSSLLEPPTVT